MRILLVEDQPKLAAHLVRGLAEDGHTVEHIKDGTTAATVGLRSGHDVIVLDWALPGRDGLDVLKEWRGRGLKTPVLMLTARDTLEERVQALRSGADDHLGKPFAYDELLARLEALHRRAGGSAKDTVGDVELDREAHTLTGPRDDVTLTAREYTLFAELLAHRGDVCTRGDLLQTVWGDDLEVAQNVVDVYVGYLRQKLLACGAARLRIATVRGAGYRLVVDSDAGADADPT
jgi:DNA-binding response OmpR family regulator